SRPPLPPPFPYTTLFRSLLDAARQHHEHVTPAVRRIHDAGIVVHHLTDPSRLVRDARPRWHAGRDALVELLAAEDDEHRVAGGRSEEHTSELQSRVDLVC